VEVFSPMIISVAQVEFIFLALTRVLALIIQIPILGGQNIPTQVRLGLGVLLTLILFPIQDIPKDVVALDLLGLALSIFKEILIGLIAGFAANLTFAAVEIAGEVMGIGSGFSSDRVFNPAMNNSSASFNQLFIMVALLVFILMDGHHTFIIAIQRTFEIIPINGPIPMEKIDQLGRMVSMLIVSGVQLGLPLLAALTLADMTLGLLSRVAPQVQVYFIGLPMKVGIALYGLGIFFLVAYPVIRNLFEPLGNRSLQMLVK
jgi:flagellar biosynthesis protein FliR